MKPPPLPVQVRSGAKGPFTKALRPPSPSLLNLDEVARFESLLIFAKSVVEGYFAGRHKSPYRGSAAEFADYKEYVAGDDLSRLDWRVYGRTRRLYVRQFEEETDMVVYLMVDTSGSMRYAGEKRPSKFILAARVAAALAYLMLSQGDKAALALFAQTLTTYVPPGGTRLHLHRIVTELEQVLPSMTTGIANAISQSNSLFKKRGRLVILSDFLGDTERLFDALSQFVHRKFEILLLQVLDPDELHLPSVSAAKFVDLETGEEVQVDAEEIREEYRARMHQFVGEIARQADLLQVQHQIIDTRRPYMDAIEAYLGFRAKNQVGR